MSLEVVRAAAGMVLQSEAGGPGVCGVALLPRAAPRSGRVYFAALRARMEAGGEGGAGPLLRAPQAPPARPR